MRNLINEISITQNETNKPALLSTRLTSTVLRIVGLRFAGLQSVIAAVLALTMFASTAFAQRNLKDIPIPDSEVERKSFIVADGFEVNLYAADPAIAKPIQMNFDPQGRLWVASSEIYPHIKPGQGANDKVLVIEDTDQDGTADVTRVFADGLLIPTGVAPGDGGAYIANSTELLHMTDSDGDGKADTRRVVLSGFGTEDTHHILHTLRWGPAGHLYFNQSIYIHSHLETPYGVRRLNAGGIWRYRPETMQLDVYMRGLVNSWGHAFDQFGQSFATDGAGGAGINYIVPGAYYVTAYGANRILQGLNPGSPKHCGLEIVSGRHLPDDWQGNALTHDFRGHRVCRFVLSEDGSGYSSRQETELIKTKHGAFRPIDVKMGPDGAIYIADWYNPIIQHGEVDFHDPRRDHTHGRIWRVTRKDRPTLPFPKLVDASTEQLLENLKSAEGWTVHQSKRILKERDAQVIEPTRKWIDSIQGDDAESDRLRLEGLWTLQSVRQTDEKLLTRLLRSSDGRVRAAATRVIGHWKSELPSLVAELNSLAVDPTPRVRLEAIRVLAEVPADLAREKLGALPIEVAIRALDLPTDRFLDYALWLTARETKSDWLPELQKGQLAMASNSSHLAFALRAVGTADAVAPLVTIIEQGNVEPQQMGEFADMVATVGGPKELGRLFQLALNGDEQRQQSIMTSLAKAGGGKVIPAGDIQRIAVLVDSKNENVRRAAIQCAGLWKATPLEGKLIGLAQSAETEEKIRQSAIVALTSLGSDECRKVLFALTRAEQPTFVRQEAIAGLSRYQPQRSVAAAIEFWKNAQDIKQPELLFNVLLGTKNGGNLLAKTLVGKKIPADVARVGLRTISASGRPNTSLQTALTEAGDLQAAPKPMTPDELQAMVAAVVSQGNAKRGEVIYRRNDMLCMTCHAIGGAGGRVGPDMVSLGSSAPVDYIVESLLYPNKKVKENYHTVIATTDSGRVFSGVKVRQSDSVLVLRDASDKEIEIPVKSIDEAVPGGSIMPAGLTQKLTRGEFLDLVKFLSELGRSVTVGKEQVVRRWQVMQSTPEAGFRLRRTSYDTAATDDPAYTWAAAYSEVAGALAVGDVPDVKVRNRVAKGARGVGFARFDVDVTTAGMIQLNLNDTSDLEIWQGNRPIEVKPEMKLELPRGSHRFTVSINLANRESDLRVELVEVEGSAARAQVVSGK